MNTRFARIGSFSLLLSLATFAAVCALPAQTIEPPPVKMGLWQTESNTSMAGMANTPGGSKHTIVTQGCLTPETWKSEFAKFQKREDQDCKVTDMHQDSHALTVDETCASPQYNTTMHIDALFENSEHMHGTGKVHITGPAFPQGMTMDFALSSRYLSSSCGDVKPGEAKVIHE
jgi:Protein of unknown function (DUF3617)